MLRLAILSHRPKDESEVLLKFRYLIGYLIVTRGNLSADELGLISQYGQPDARHDCKPRTSLTTTDQRCRCIYRAKQLQFETGRQIREFDK